MQAVILAAGMGSRLGDLKRERPKGFLKPSGLSETLIERSVRILLDNGINSIVIGTGYQEEYYENFAKKFSNIITCKNPYYATTGSGYTLHCLKDCITEDFLLLESDLLYESKAIEILLSDVRKNLILASGATHSGDEVYLQIKENKLVNISKKREDLQHIDGELVGISKISIEKYHELKFSTHKDYEYLLQGFEVLKIDNLLWCEIDMLEHLRRAESIIIPKIGD